MNAIGFERPNSAYAPAAPSTRSRRETWNMRILPSRGVWQKDIRLQSGSALVPLGTSLAQEPAPLEAAVNGTASIAVGTLIAERPPHRTVRAAFPHTAPTLGN